MRSKRLHDLHVPIVLATGCRQAVVKLVMGSGSAGAISCQTLWTFGEDVFKQYLILISNALDHS